MRSQGDPSGVLGCPGQPSENLLSSMMAKDRPETAGAGVTSVILFSDELP